MYTILQLSPTGNTAYVAGLLAKKLETKNVQAIEHTDPISINLKDHIIIMFSIHAFNAPRTVKRFVKRMPESGGTSVSVIAVGCNTSWINDAATVDIAKFLQKKGYKIKVQKVMAMPLSFVMRFPEDIVAKQLKEINHAICEVCADIHEDKTTKVQVPFKTKMIHPVGHVESFAARMFGLELHAKSTCIQCGLCVKDCPEKNIKMTADGKIKFGFKCMLCMRCIYQCPTSSITPWISKFIPIKGGYSIQQYLDKKDK